MNEEQQSEKSSSVRSGVMDAIQKGRIQMRPRWHFVLLSILALVGVLILFLTLLYVSSLALFFLRDSGVWVAPSFGMRGWWTVVRGVPWFLVFLVAIFILVLELLVRRYAFVYQKPLLASVVGILILIVVGGFAIAQTPMHRQLALSARHGDLPPPLQFWYGDMFRAPQPDELYRGVIISIGDHQFVIVDPGTGTTTVILTPRTRLPYGEDFSVGASVVVIGDVVATDTIQAFGVAEVDN
jgi:hypothetical protein